MGGSHLPRRADGEPAGLGIRESDGLITDNLSYFVPHTIGYVPPRSVVLPGTRPREFPAGTNM